MGVEGAAARVKVARGRAVKQPASVDMRGLRAGAVDPSGRVRPAQSHDRIIASQAAR